MIRISRGPEPEESKRQRRRRLAIAVMKFNKGESLSEILKEYSAGKQEIFTAQHRKCVWCERKEGSGSVIEHFRPKEGAWRNLRDQSVQKEPEYYWWLAWSWVNRFFACQTCNDKGHKGNYFPLVGTGRIQIPPKPIQYPLPQDCFRLDLEQALLVDPAREDPMNFIRWKPSNAGVAPELLKWIPIEIDLDPRGTATISILGLTDNIASDVSDHIRDVVWPRVRTLRDHFESNAGKAKVEWDAMLRELVSPNCMWAAASHDALCYFVPRKIRQKWNLSPINHPNQNIPFDPALDEDIPDPPGFARLPPEVCWLLCAEEGNVKDRIHLVCQHGTWTKDALIALFPDLEPETVKTAIRELLHSSPPQLCITPGTTPTEYQSCP